jgi:hypothetical protein
MHMASIQMRRVLSSWRRCWSAESRFVVISSCSLEHDIVCLTEASPQVYESASNGGQSSRLTWIKSHDTVSALHLAG